MPHRLQTGRSQAQSDVGRRSHARARGWGTRTPVERSDAPSIAGAVAQFALTGLIVLVVFLIGSVLVFRSLGRSEGLRDARQFAVLTGQGIVEPALRNGVLRSDSATLAALDRIVQERVLGDRVVRVKIWNAAGRIVYSDEPRLIGETFPLDDSKLEVLRTGAARAELSSLEGAENRFERGSGGLYEVYLPVRVPDGTPLLYETYQRSESVAVHRPPDLAPVRRAVARQSLPALARPGSPGVAPGQAAPAKPGGARSAARPRARGIRRRAPPSRRRSSRRRRPGPRGRLVLAQRDRRARRLGAAERITAASRRRSERNARRYETPALCDRRDPPAQPPGLRARSRTRRRRLPARGGQRQHDSRRYGRATS